MNEYKKLWYDFIDSLDRDERNTLNKNLYLLLNAIAHGEGSTGTIILDEATFEVHIEVLETAE